MCRLAELVYQAPEVGGRQRENPAAPGARGKRVELPAQPVFECVWVAVDEALRGQDLQRARHLALLAAEQLGNSHHAEPAVVGGLILTQRKEDVQGAADRSTLSNHSCSLCTIS